MRHPTSTWATFAPTCPCRFVNQTTQKCIFTVNIVACFVYLRNKWKIKEVVWRYCCTVAVNDISIVGAWGIGKLVVSAFFSEAVMMRNNSKTSTKVVRSREEMFVAQTLFSSNFQVMLGTEKKLSTKRRQRLCAFNSFLVTQNPPASCPLGWFSPNKKQSCPCRG